jgi:hypothetical protein
MYRPREERCRRALTKVLGLAYALFRATDLLRHLQLGPMIAGDRPEVVHGDRDAAIGFVRFALVSCPQPNGFLELARLSALSCIAVRARARSAATRERSSLEILR